MKTFNEHKNQHIILNESDFTYLDEVQKEDVQNLLIKYGDVKIHELDESLLGKIVGGLSGFVVGPAIGKVIANALGVQRGIIYDMLTSRLVGSALGAAITKYIKGR